MVNKDLKNKVPDKHRTKHRAQAEGRRALPPGAACDAAPSRDHRKYIIPDKSVEIVIAACLKGVPETKLAQALGINYRTWMRVREEDERIADVLAEGRKIEEEELVSLLLNKARNGDLTATIFALKSRHGYRDMGTPGGGVEQKVNVTINLPAPASSEEEFRRIIDGTPEVVVCPN